MARKRHWDEDILKLLREIELKLAADAAGTHGVGQIGGLLYQSRRLSARSV